MSTQNLPQTAHNGQSQAPAPDPTNAAAWLQAKINHYQAEITRLEKELKVAKVLLRGHQTWLQDIERKGR